MIKAQSTSHGFHQPDPVRPVTPDQIEIAAALGAVVGIERCCPECAISVDAAFFVQHSSGGKIATKDAEAPLTDFQLLG